MNSKRVKEALNDEQGANLRGLYETSLSLRPQMVSNFPLVEASPEYTNILHKVLNTNMQGEDGCP